MSKRQWTNLFKLNFYSKARGYPPAFLFLVTPFCFTDAYAAVIRHDIDYREYIKFGNNAGKYDVGNTDVQVYKKDDSLSTGAREGAGGTSIPLMPDFYSVSDKGFATPVSHNIIVTAAHMVDQYSNETYGKRFYRTDLNLFEASNSEPKLENNLDNYLRFILSDSELAKENHDYGYRQDVNLVSGSGAYPNTEVLGYDASMIRTEKMMFDVIPYEFRAFSGVKEGDLLLRNGAGTFIQPNTAPSDGIGMEYRGNTYRYVHGSLTLLDKINPEAHVGSNNLSYQLMPDAKTAFDSTSLGGDSGSPVFWWDNDKQKWLLLGVNSRAASDKTGSIMGYGKQGIMQELPNLANVLHYRTKQQTVTDGQTITFSDKNIGSHKYAVLNLTDKQNGTTSIDLLKHYASAQNAAPKVQDLYLTNPNGGSIEVKINGDTDIGAIPIYFETDAIISGNGKFDLSGMSVADGKVVTATLALAQGTDWRKVGKGTLRLQGTERGYGSVAIGDGILELNTKGIAANKIMLATGRATVKLMADGQLNNNEVYFGVRGGALDLNGQNLSFSDIYHMDRGANITNSNSTTKSTFTFTANQERNYLGGFNGNLDVKYAPTDSSGVWNLRGDSKIDGDFAVTKGQVNVTADRLIYGTSLISSGLHIASTLADDERREWRPNTFQAKTITLSDNTTLGVGRAATVIADTVTFNGSSKLDIAITDAKRHAASAAVSGDKFMDPTSHNPTVKANLEFKGNNNAININSPEGFIATIEGGMNGKADITTDDSGKVIWKNSNPTVLQTKINAKSNPLQIDNSSNLDLSFSTSTDNLVLNNKQTATLRFAPTATALGDKTQLNLANGSKLTFAGVSGNDTSKNNVAINANIQLIPAMSRSADNGNLPTITLASGNTTFNFKQDTLDSNLALQNGSLGLSKALTIAGNLTADPASPLSNLVFGTIGTDKVKATGEKEYELTNKLTVKGNVSGVVQPIFQLSEDVTAMLVDSMNKLTFVDYSSGALRFENAPRVVNKGVEFSFTQNSTNTLLVEKDQAAIDKEKAEREAAEAAEKARLEAEAKAKAEEEARIAAEKAKAEAERLAKEKAEREAAEAAEKARLEAEAKAKAEEDARIAAEKAKAEAERLEKEKAEREAAEAAEKARLEAEAKAKAEEEARLAAEKAKAEAERLAKEKAEREAAEAAEKARLEAEAKVEEERLAAEKAEQDAIEKAKAEEDAKQVAEKAQAEADAKALEEAEKAKAEEAAKAENSNATKVSLTAKTAPEVGEYLTLIGSARNVINIDLNSIQLGFSIAYEGYYERDNYRHDYNFNSKVNGKGVLFNLANRIDDLEAGIQVRLADLTTSTESEKVRLNSKTKLTSVIGYTGYYLNDLKFYGALGVANARFDTKIDGQAVTSMNSRFSSTGVFAKAGMSYAQSFGNISIREYVALSYNNLGLGNLTDSNGDQIKVSDNLPLRSEFGVIADFNADKWTFSTGIGASYDLGKLQVRYVDTDRSYTRGIGKLKLNLDLGSQYQVMPNFYLTQDVKMSLDSKNYRNAIFNFGVRFNW